MSNENVNLEIDDYSITDMLTILELIDQDIIDNIDEDNIMKSITNNDIIKKTTYYIEKFKNEYDEDMASFFQEIQYRLTAAKKKYHSDDNNSMKKNVLTPPINLKTDSRYIVTPNLLFDGGDSDVPVINEKTQDVTNTFIPSVVKGTTNPLLTNTFTTFMNIDSRYRQYTSTNSNTDFILDLSEPLKRLLSLQLYSYQIPFSWYIIDSSIGNTCFWIEDLSTNTIVNISIDSGNYTPTSLTTELNSKIVEAGFVFGSTTKPFYYKETQTKIIFNLYGGTYQVDGKEKFTINENTRIIFFDFNFTLECNSPNCGIKLPNYLNETLGWILGFRSPFIYVNPKGNVPSAVLDLNGTRYLIIVIDDYNQNHVNNNLISITEYDNNLKLPSYYNRSLTYSCNNPVNNSNLLFKNINLNENINADNIILDKLDINYSKTQHILPSAPRTLTQSEIYTASEIIKNNKKNGRYFSKAPTNSDSFAIIPIKSSNNPNNNGVTIVEFSGSLAANKRTYWGPVHIQRMHIRLLDDRGNTLNLNDVPWSFIIQATCLYEY